jgi:hypothetical protein
MGFAAIMGVIQPCDPSTSHARDIGRAAKSTARFRKYSRLYGEVHEKTDWIVSTLPRKFGNGKNAGG